jgi:hypothetical protein
VEHPLGKEEEDELRGIYQDFPRLLVFKQQNL